MDEQRSQNNVLLFPTSILTNTTESDERLSSRIIENFLLVCVGSNIDESNQFYEDSLEQLQRVMGEVHIFQQPDASIDFITDVADMKVFMIISAPIDACIIPLIHNIPQIEAIYILCNDKSLYDERIKQWTKVKGVHTDISSICDSLQLAIRQFNQDSVTINLTDFDEDNPNKNFNELEPSFMYTQMMTEILLDMKYNEQSKKDFITYCRQLYIDNTYQLNVINEFECNYQPHMSIWWYTRECFIYQMLNRALRTLEVNTIINMGFFIRDLHHQISQLHQSQIRQYDGKSFWAYRGQGLSTIDFEKLQNLKHGLISFNNFLSTSKNSDVSMCFAQASLTRNDTVGIVFRMLIDPQISSIPFALTIDNSYFHEEGEILFSMHSVFRVCEIIRIDNNHPVFQVNLKLTADDDERQRTLTEYIRTENTNLPMAVRLGNLLLQIGQFSAAEEYFEKLLTHSTDEMSTAISYNNLGKVKFDQGDYLQSLLYYEKALEIRRKALPENHSELAISYNNIGSVYCDVGEYSKALSYYEKALEISRKTLPANHPSLATSYNNIGLVYSHMGEYSKALFYYEKALDSHEKILPANHPSLGSSYNNIGGVYNDMGDYSKALLYYEKALEITKKSLPSTHPDLATSYNNSGAVYNNMGEYSKALSCYERALQIFEKTIPANHPDLATSYNNIAEVYKKMGEYSKALSYSEKALKIRKNTLPENHPLLGSSYNSIGGVYDDIGEYSKALLYYEKSLQIRQKILPTNHPDVATCYNNIGGLYENLGDYSKALLYYEKSFQIREKTLPANHPSLATSYNNISLVYEQMGEYSKALSFAEKALEIFQKTLPENHPDLANSFNNIGTIYQNMGEYSKALACYEKGFEIFHRTFPENHPSLASSYTNMGGVFYNMNDYSKALTYLEKGRNIYEKVLPPNHPSIKNSKYGIELIKKNVII